MKNNRAGFPRAEAIFLIISGVETSSLSFGCKNCGFKRGTA